MKNYICIENEGEIGIHNIRLLGHSNKNGDQIGQFGTGLKEAIVLFLRLDIPFTILSGVDRITFFKDVGESGVEEVKYECDGIVREMNLATTFGEKDWTDTWQAFREVVCNALDEPGHKIEETDAFWPEAGKTKVYIEATMPVMKEFYSLSDKILQLSNKKPMYKGAGGAIYKGQGNIYHKGIWVRTFKDSLLSYDLPNLRLSESRTADVYDCVTEVRAAILACTDIDVLEVFYRGLEENDFHRKVASGGPYPCASNILACKRVWGDNYCFTMSDAYRVSKKGFNPVVVDHKLFCWFKSLGCQVDTNILSETDFVEEDPPYDDVMEVFGEHLKGCRRVHTDVCYVENGYLYFNKGVSKYELIKVITEKRLMRYLTQYMEMILKKESS